MWRQIILTVFAGLAVVSVYLTKTLWLLPSLPSTVQPRRLRSLAQITVKMVASGKPKSAL